MRFVGLVMAFLVIIVMAFLAIGFTSSQPKPDINTSAGQQYNNLSNNTEIAFAGVNGAMILLVIAIVFSALFLLMKAIT